MDGFADTFDMTEPLPPNEVPTSPGPGFAYDGGTVVYTNSNTLTTAQNGQFQNGQLWYAQYSFSRSVNIPAGGALSVRRMHVAENNSPLPRDRGFFDYRYFNKPLGVTNELQWYTFGMEKTFNRSRGSIDIRLPFAYTVSGEQFVDDPGMRSLELGNVTLNLKHVLWGTDRYILSGGTGVSIPTGDETRIFLSDGTQILTIDNDSVFLQPFLAGMWLPNEAFFMQSFVQVDCDLSGNDVSGNLQGGRLPTIGNLRSAYLLIADLGAGYWVYSNPSQNVWFQALSLVGELNYETTLQDTDVVSGNGLTVTEYAQQYRAFNATVATHAYLGNRLALSGGLSFPLSQGKNKEFDYSAIFMANWLF